MFSTLQVFSTIATYAAAPGSTVNFPITNNFTEAGANTEAESQITCRVAGTLSKLAVRVIANTLSTASTTLKVRINGSDGNQSITIPAGSTGYFVDTSNSDAISATDLFCAQSVVAAGGTGTIQFKCGSMNFSANTDHGVYWGGAETSILVNDVSTTEYLRLAGDIGEQTSESGIAMQLDAAGTLQNLQIYVDTNGCTNAVTVKSRINGSDGNQSITIPAGSTGLFEDTTNTDSVSVGDDVNISLVTGAGTVSLRLNRAGMIFTNSSGQNDVFTGRRSPGSRSASATPTYYSIGGAICTSVTETDVQLDHNFNGATSKLKIYVSANSYTGSATVRVRKNSGDGNQSITIPAGSTGLFEDTTNTDSFISTDDFCYSIIGGTSGSMTVNWIGILENNIITEVMTLQAKARIKVLGNDKTVSAKARVKQADITKTVSAKARILVVNSKTISAKADIFNTLTKTVQAKADIKVFDVTKTVTAKARIKILGNDKMVSSKARVKIAGVTKTVSAKARINAQAVGLILGIHRNTGIKYGTRMDVIIGRDRNTGILIGKRT